MVLEMEFWALHVVDKHNIYTSILGSYLLIFVVCLYYFKPLLKSR